MVPGAGEVVAVLLRGRAADPGLRHGRRGPPLHHHQRLQRVAAGRRHGALPAGAGRPAQAAAELRRAGHELRPQPTPDRHAEERRVVGPRCGADRRVGHVNLWRGPPAPGPGQPHAQAGPGPQ